MQEGSHRYHNTAATCLAPLFEQKLYFSLLGKGGNFNQLLLQLCSAPQEQGDRGACAIRSDGERWSRCQWVPHRVHGPVQQSPSIPQGLGPV